MFFCLVEKKVSNIYWLVVEPTHLKNISQNGFIFPKDRGENNKYLKPYIPSAPKYPVRSCFKTIQNLFQNHLHKGSSEHTGISHEFCHFSWESKGTPPMPPPPGNKALIRPY